MIKWPPPASAARHEAATAAHLIGPLQPRSRAEAELLALLGKWHSRNGKCFKLPPLTTNHFRRKWNFHSLNQPNLMEPFMLAWIFSRTHGFLDKYLKISQIILSKKIFSGQKNIYYFLLCGGQRPVCLITPSPINSDIIRYCDCGGGVRGGDTGQRDAKCEIGL